jgi:hypothetical protein
VRIGLARDRVRQAGPTARMQRGRSSGKASDCEVEAAPEEMDGAHLAEEAASEELEHAVDLHEGTPEAMCRGSVEINQAHPARDGHR